MYQGYARGFNRAVIDQLEQLVSYQYMPEITIILDVDTETGLSRALSATAECETRFENEKMEFHQRVREGYCCAAVNEPERCIIVDTTHLDESQVFEQVLIQFNQRTKGRYCIAPGG